MDIKSLKLMAAVSTVVLGLAFAAPGARAEEMDDATDTTTVNVTAAVANTVTMVTTDMAFGNLGVTSDAADTATITMDPTTGAIVDDTAAGTGLNEAHIVSDTNTGTPASITVSGALINTDIYVYYSNLVDLTDGAAPDLTLASITDDLATAGGFVASGAVQTVGKGTTDGSGGLVWHVGATISTIATALRYDTNTYTGSFDVDLAY